jgi:hypothetical protein
MGAEFFHADRQADMKLIVAFRKFASAPVKATVVRLPEEIRELFSDLLLS